MVKFSSIIYNMKANFETKLKICSKCKVEQPIANFCKNKSMNDGLKNNCKNCEKQYRQDNKEKNKEKNKEYSKQYYKKNAEKIKQYQQDNLEEIKEYSRQYYQDNKEKNNEQSSQYYQNHLKEMKEYYKQYRKDHKKELNNYENNRRKSDPIHRLVCILRTRLNIALKQKSFRKISKFKEYIGCSLEELKNHIENQFQPGMNWQNHGRGKDKWHIDHMVPLDACEIYSLDRTFNDELSTKRLFELCHYTNLQPLWEDDNLKKGNKI